MKFIFPHNYKFKTKLLGIFDYSTIIINLIWFGIIFLICNILNLKIFTKIYILIIFCFPILLLTTISFYHENVIYILLYVISFFKKSKIYIYKKY